MIARDAGRLPRLFLIRHGETDWAATHRHTGRTDVPLNARGEAAAGRLRARFEAETFARVFTSPLVRARRTCELAGFLAQAELDADLLEWDYGDYEGRTTAEILQGRPGWNLFRDGAAGGESPEMVAARADRIVALAREVEGDVAAFASGHIVRMIAARWLGLDPLAAGYFFASTASVGVLGFEHDRSEPVVLLWNDAHAAEGA